MKYKQKIVPATFSEWPHLPLLELRNTAFEYYRENIAGKVVTNLATGFPIHFTVRGGRKLLKGGNIYASKAELVRVLPQIMRVAAFNNWGDRKPTDKKHIAGYLNFKCTVLLDNTRLHLRIAVRLCTNGKLYYNHEVNKGKK